MAMVCPQCSTSHDQRLQCPACGSRLFFPDVVRPRTHERGTGPRWQQSPWGRILIGLLLAQGLFYGLRHLLTGVVLALQAEGTSQDAWRAVAGVVLMQVIQLVTLLPGSILAGSGQRQGILLGAVVGVWNGVLLAFTITSGPALGTAGMAGLPLLQAVCGALGGWVGCLIWKPLPTVGGTGDTRIVLRKQAAPRKRRRPLFAGPIAWVRVAVGIALGVAGTLTANYLFEQLLAVSSGRLSTPAELQNQVFTWEIKALAVFLGGVLAGATTANGLKQGLVVGLGTSVLLIGIKAPVVRDLLEFIGLTIVSSLTLALVGGLFGGQLFPPVVKLKRGRDLGAAPL